MRSPSNRLSVSMTGSIGIAAPYWAAASATARTRAGLTSGRAASWTRTTGSAWAAGGEDEDTVAAPRRVVRPATRAASAAASSPSAITPAATDSCLRSPPATTATTESGSHVSAAISATRASDATMTIRSTPAAARASTDHCSTGCPKQVRSQLVAAAHPAAGAGSNDDRLQVGCSARDSGSVSGFSLNSGTHSE